LAGTIHYLSPEQVAGKPVGPQSDLFSLGVVAYELATGKVPFDGPTEGAIFDAILNRTPPAPSTVRPALGTELDGLIMRALEKDPELRFQTAGDLRSSCRRLARDYAGGAIDSAQPSASSAGMGAQPAKSQRRRGMAAAACLALALAAVFFWLTRQQPPPRVTGITQITRDGLYKAFYVTDGPRLYYAAGLADPSVSMFQVSSKGGDPVRMPLLTGMFPLDISPDRSEMLLGQFPKGTPINVPSAIWVADTLGNTPRRVGGLMAEYACWSPDGKEIVYSGGSELRIAASDGSQSRLLLKVTGVPESPAWSADGQSIRFLLQAKNSAALWDVNSDGSGLRQVFPGWVNHRQGGGSWTPNGRSFVFWALRTTGDIPDLWETTRSIALLGRVSPVQLTTGPMMASVPRISPDGRRVYFIGGSNHGELVRYDSKTRQWAPYLGGISAMQLDYSRDGQWVTWVSCPERSVWRSAVDGSQRLQLTPPIFAVNPRWSPDGTQIVFYGGPAGTPDRVFIVPAAGGAVKDLTHGEGGPSGDTDPSWSPDGTSLVFGAQSIDQRDQRIGSALEILDSKTGRVSKLPGTEGLWSPRWSPDGRYVAALGFPNKLMLYELKHGARTELTTFGAGFPAWSRDSDYLYFEDSAMAAWYRVGVKDRKVEKLASLTGLRMAPLSLGWVGLAPDGSLISTRDAGSTEIFRLDWDAR
jgi:Tol biopolymer transport system component